MGTRPARGGGAHGPHANFSAAGRAGARAAVGAWGARAALAALLAGAVLGPAAARATDPPHESLQGFPQAELVVEGSAGKTHPFRVWVAATEPRREQGLMWVRALESRQGMLFVFDQPQLASFWMKNTLIPLDLMFISPDGHIIRVAANTTPRSLAAIHSMGVVRGVLEVAGGTAGRLGIRPGHRVRYPAFSNR